MNEIEKYHPLGHERRKTFIAAALNAKEHFHQLGNHVPLLENPRGLDNGALKRDLHFKVSDQLQNLATDIERGSFGGVSEIFAGLASAFNKIYKAAENSPDEHEYQNHFLASLLRFFSTPGLKQAAYDLQDDLAQLVQTTKVSPPVALHQAVAA